MNRSRLCLLIFFAAFAVGCGNKAEIYSRTKSPDGRFEIVVYRKPMRFAMPGQGSDAPGYIHLCDAAGKILKKTNVDMVQNVGKIEWSETNVSIKLIAEWKLPK